MSAIISILKSTQNIPIESIKITCYKYREFIWNDDWWKKMELVISKYLVSSVDTKYSWKSRLYLKSRLKKLYYEQLFTISQCTHHTEPMMHAKIWKYASNVIFGREFMKASWVLFPRRSQLFILTKFPHRAFSTKLKKWCQTR